MSALARWITLAFVLLALGLGAMIGGYWHLALKPGIQNEAQQQADLMAQAQAARLAAALVAAVVDGSSHLLTEVRNEVLSFTDSDSGQPFFAGVDIEPAPDLGALDPALRQHGDIECRQCLVAEVPLLHPRDYHLIGVARFLTTDQFLRQYLRAFRRHLLIQAALGALLLLSAWAGVMLLTRQMQRQRLWRERAEQSSAWTQARYERLLNRLEGYFVYARSGEGSLIFASESVRRVMGCAPEVFCREPERFFVDADAGSSLFPLTIGQAEQSASRVLRVRTAQGQARQLECTETLALNAPEGQVVIEGVARDVSTQKELEASLLEAKERAESANRAKTALLTNVSHELRTPMASIIGLAKLMLRAESPAPQRDQVGKILAAAQSLLRILDDILDVSKMEAGRVRLDQRAFALDQVLEQVANFAAIKNQAAALDIAFAIGPGVPRYLRGDPVRLGQVLLNLTSNAIKFTPRGSVLLCVEQLKGAQNSQGARGPDRGGHHIRLKFTLEDTGIGISRQDLQRLFQPFSQLDNASSHHNQGGTGLGLAISRHLVRLMGGEIEVESQPGQGSSFQFTADFGLVPRASCEPSPAWSWQGMRALIVSERELTQALFGQMLNGLGLAVAMATSTGQASAILGTACQTGAAFALVLLDALLADAPVASIARQLHQQPGLGQKPALLLIERLGFERGADAQVGSADVDGVVTPALSHSALLRVLQAVLPGAAPSPAHRHAAPPVHAHPASVPPGTRVLVADDHRVNREIAVDVLNGLGFEVTAAADGFEALESLARADFDALLLDIRMPGLDGFEVTKRLRAEPRLARLPVIALTAHAMMEDAEPCHAAGMTAVMSKPINETALLEILLPHLGKRSFKHPPNLGPVASQPVKDDSSAVQYARAPAAEAVEEGARMLCPSDLQAAPSEAQAEFLRQLSAALPSIIDYLGHGGQADAIAVAQRLKTGAQAVGASAASDALSALQRAVVKGASVDEPLQRLEWVLVQG
ncbi:Signal transduction histidine-protein kinase BarA [Thiorhodovibrio winogradskyi]|uniref:histidine kinase n=1 Tax=Thiorhodovibrio winogradskyi TaxID=77007 RepID=A0ABZ0S4M7_9GAMM|nr:response regulator [Thiorhodovibrio winogradskyi]